MGSLPIHYNDSLLICFQTKNSNINEYFTIHSNKVRIKMRFRLIILICSNIYQKYSAKGYKYESKSSKKNLLCSRFEILNNSNVKFMKSS